MSFESVKAKELATLIDDARSGEDEFVKMIEPRIFPILNQIRKQFSENPLVVPFFGYKDNELFMNLAGLMELTRGVGQSLQVRRNVLEIFSKISVSFDPTIPVVFHITLCDVLWEVIESVQSVEDEETALIAVRIFVELYKESGSVLMDAELSTRLHRFVSWLRQMFANSESIFDSSTHSSVGIKLLKESANITQALVHAFPGAAESFLANLVGDMIGLLNLGDTAKVSPDTAPDLFEVQVKTLGLIGTFLARLRGGEILKPFDQAIAKSCVRLLKSIPVDNIYLRRDLILGIRAYIQHSPEAAGWFVPFVDDLFDDAIVVGIGKSAYEILRPVVVSTLADFANLIVRSPNHVPTGEKLKKIFAYFCSCMSDSELPISSQFTSARIILNIIDQLYNRAGGRSSSVKQKTPGAASPAAPPEASAEILRDVLRAMVEKFSSLILFMPRVIALIANKLDLESDFPVVRTLCPRDLDESTLLSRLIGKPNVPVGIPLTDVLIEGVREVRSLIRTLLLSVKMILHCLTHRSASAPHRTLTKSDMSLVESMFEDSLKVSHLFSIAAGLVQSTGFDPVNINASSNGNGRFSSPRELAVACSVQEERDLLEQIGSLLQILPPVSLVDLLAKRIGWLIENIQVNNQLMSLTNVLIQHPQSIQSVCEVVFGYISLKGESLILAEKNQQLFSQRQLIVDNGEIDPAFPGLKLAESVEWSSGEIGPSAARLLYHTFVPSNKIGENVKGLNTSSYCLGYYEGEVDANVTSALVTHVMPSLNSKLRVYSDLVSLFGLREPSTTRAIDKRDVVITLLKTLSRQTSSPGTPPLTPTFLEPIIRPFVPEIVTTCLKIARTFPEDFSVYSAIILRYTFRLMGSGTKTTSSIRELSDSLPLFIETCVQMWRFFEGTSKYMQAMWLEIGLTIPVRLKTLVPNFEQIMSVMVLGLTSDNTDCVAIALTVLESWVDGLTPDFLFPLIPGHGEASLSSALLGLTKPPFGHVVHTTVSGNNSVRATKILGKLGARTKFTLKSNNVVGFREKEFGSLSTKFPLSVGADNLVIDFDLSEAILVSLKILAKHALVTESYPVSVGEAGLEESTTTTLVPEQELYDSFNIVMTAYVANRAIDSGEILCVLGKGLIDACACTDAGVAERARAAVNDLIVTDVQTCFENDKKNVTSSNLPGVVMAAITSLRGDKGSSRQLGTSVSLISGFVEEYIRTYGRSTFSPQSISNLSTTVSEQLVSGDWATQSGAGYALLTLLPMIPKSVLSAEFVLGLLKNCVSGYTLAEGTSATIPSIKTQRILADLSVTIVKTVFGSKFFGDRETKAQESQTQWLSQTYDQFSPLINFCVTEFCVDNKSLAEFLLYVIADVVNVSVSALVCWVDEKMDTFVDGLRNTRLPGHGNHPVFKIASFILQLRPAPVVAADGGERLHLALLDSINKAIEWLEREDDLAIVYGAVPPLPGGGPPPPGVAPHQHQSYLMQRGVLRRSLMNWTDQNTKILQAVRVVKLTVLHTQLGASNQPCTVPGYLISGVPSAPVVGGSEFDANHPGWLLEDRIFITLCRMLFSFDPEAVAAASYSITSLIGIGSRISDLVWKQSLLTLCREIASRAPIAMNEIQGLGRLLLLLPSEIDDSIRVDLTERLFERMHTYLGVLRERTFAPIQQAILQNNLPGGIPSQNSGPVISWRAGVHSDSVVVLAANTLACFSGLVSDRLPLTERLLVLATQLDSALPATHGTGQLTSPFLAPLVASLCRDPERTADQLLTKMEIHKVFGFVAELVSLRSCLGLRKALQDRCHQMSSTETTGVLMMRTPAASLISVLARHDPSFLWLQYASSAAMMKTTSAIRSVSLVESIVRNWETAVAGLTTSTSSGTPGMCVCPGGILGPIDMTNSVTGYEGRIIAWTIMQFIRAPAAVSPAIVEDLESHLNVRVRLLIRLATCLSLRTMIDVSPVRDWFLTEAVELTSETEKIEIVSKAIEAFQDSTISVGCKYALLKYLVVPQVAKLSSWDILPVEKLVSVLLNVHAHTSLVEEGIRVEIVQLCATLIRNGSQATQASTQFLLSNLSIDRYLTRQWTQSLICELIATKRLPSSVLHTLLRSMVMEDSLRRRAVSYDLRNANVFSAVGKQIAEVLQSDSELVNAIVNRLQGARDLSGANLGLWRWFILIARAASSASVIPQSLLRVCLSAVGKSKLTSSSATTDMRVIGLEVLSLVADWAYQLKDKATAQLVANTVVRLVVVGPEPSVNVAGPTQQQQPGSSGTSAAPSSAVSPTLISEFLNKCVATFVRCMEVFPDLKLDLSTVIDQASLALPKQAPQAPGPAAGSNGTNTPPAVNMETIRHCRSLVCLIRVLNEYYKLSPSATSSGHLMRLIGLAMISTDKSVCQILCLLVETLVGCGRFPVDNDLFQFIVSGISAGLAVASNKTSGRVRVNPLNPNSHAFSVTPYMGVALCIAVLRGMVRAGYSVADSLSWLQSSLKDALVHALTQGTRSFVFSLLPQHLHQYPLTGTKFSPPPLDPSIPAENTSSGFAYPGTLQGPDYVVPTLLHTFRLCQLILTKDDLSVFRNTVMWLIESLGPFLTFSTPNHQTFSHLLNGLNFTVPQQSQKLSGGGSSPGGLASVFSIVQLTALMRFLVLDIVASWCNVRRQDEQSIVDRMMEDSSPSLILSLSTSLVGEEALRNICDLSPLQRNPSTSPRNSKSANIDPKAIDCIVHVIECMDGLSILSSHSDPSVKRLLGFVPKRAVTCFPGSVLSTTDTHGWIGSNVAGLWSSRSCFGGLFGVAVDVLIDVMEKAGQQEVLRSMLPAVLIVAVCGEQILRNKFLPVLRSFVPSGTMDTKIDWIMNSCPWDKVAGRSTTPVVASLLLIGFDDRVWVTEEKTASPKKPGTATSALVSPPSLEKSLSAQWEWLQSVVSLTQVDTGLAYSTTLNILTAVFDIIGPDAAQKLVNSFLAKPFLSRQSLFEKSLVGAILEAANCAIAVPLLVHCARHHGLYFEVLDILESMDMEDAENFEICSAIDCLYRDLNDKDGWLGTLLLRGTEKETASAISYMQQNREKEARGILEHTMNSLAPEDQSAIAPLWSEVNKSLSQWSNLLDVVGEVKDPELKLEIFGNTNEWGQVAELMSQYDWSMKSWSKLYAAYLALSFSDSCHSGSDAPVKQKLFLADMEASLNRSYHNLVASWNLIENSQDDSLLLCQEFIEFGESANLVTEIRAAITGAKPAYPTPKQLLNTWRDRLPDKCDSIANWCEVLNLRMIIFRHIQTQCAADVVASSHIAPYLHDYPWSLVKMAHVASKNGHAEMAQSALQRFQSSITRSTTDAFNQEFFEALREQIRIYRMSDNETDWRIGLNVLNSCVISNTNAQQASEISLMQGRLLAKLGKLEEAKNALQMSVNTYPMIASGWSNLGDVLFETSNGGNSEECLMAYMQAVSLRSSKATRLIPRMLLMVEKFGLKSLADKCTDSQPSSVWIFWVPILVSALGSGSPSLATTAKALLKKLATTFPQSVFFELYNGTVSESDRLEILNQMKESSAMESFRSQLMETFGAFDPQELNMWTVRESLKDIQSGRVSVTELKSRLGGIIKGEPTENVLVKWLEKAPGGSGRTQGGSVGDYLDIARFVSTTCGNIEILGNYTRFISVPVGSTLESMSTVQIVGLDHRFETVRESGLDVPVITFVGSNGLRYSFAVRPSLGPSDTGLTAQIYALCNSLMANFAQTKQRGVQVMALQTIPLSGGVILEEVVPTAPTFEQILDNRYRSSDIVNTMVHEFEKVESKSGSKAAMEAMINSTQDDILISHIHANTYADMYRCSRTFTRSVAGLGMVDFLVGIDTSKRSLGEVCVSKDTGDLFVRVSGLKARLGDSRIPFRLTRNIQSVIGDRNMVGLLPATMRAVVDCIGKKPTVFMEFLDLIGILNQQAGLSTVASSRLNRIVEHDSEMGEPRNLLHAIIELITESMDASNLADVQPRQFLPWF